MAQEPTVADLNRPIVYFFKDIFGMEGRWSAVDEHGDLITSKPTLPEMRVHFSLDTMFFGNAPQPESFKLRSTDVWWAYVPTAYHLVARHFGDVPVGVAHWFLWGATPYPFIKYGVGLDTAIKKIHERSGGDMEKAVDLVHEDVDRVMEERKGDDDG